MATTWKDGICKFDLTYWIIRGHIPHLESIDGTIQFDLICQPLENGEKQKSYKEICKVINERCPKLITNLAKIQELSYNELTEIFINAIVDNSINVETVETDDARKIRLDQIFNSNKTFFDKYSQNVYE